MSPKPILKRSVSTDHQQLIHHHHRHQHQHQHQHPQSHAVHFPPSPSLTRTFSAHSSATYDRSPIVVSPNSCALPERGCPGRTYLLDEQVSPSPPRRITSARDYHPRALAFATTTTTNYAPVPQLVPDLSSESDESDGFYNPPNSVSQQSFGIHGLAGPSGNGYGGNAKYANSTINNNGGYSPCDYQDNDALAFLPYGPSSPPLHFINEEGDVSTSPSSPTSSLHKHRRKRSSDRRHESSVDPDRIPGGGGSAATLVDPSSLGFGSLSISPPSPSRKRTTSPPRKKGVRSTPPMMVHFQHQPPAFGFGQSDDGCLGGF